ncbi:MAG: peptidylprolyl isomerase [Bacteroidales bacterium]|nr:peptidylprolyl isomerase [Hoylesella loescheii]MCI6723620.1 peptidylprolyl isomerase [Bacteroidales bacterium]MDY3742678.1 peptidylprolyl isomerase [Prevotella sp.]MDD6028682.1 peptidylprolyl isomerase [Bacteroidales bacterium]MDD7124259.1 peptidylprolyl isomerase [Bacteroidales bacterium]
MKKTLFIILTAAIANVAAITAGVSHHSMARTADDETTDTAKTVEKKDAETVVPQKTVADEVIWVVGDEAILLSDVEQLRAQYEAEGMTLPGNPDCRLPEQIAVQKLFLHQAALDSIEVTEAEISQGVEQQINYWISMIGSKEKLEEYRKMPLTKIRQSLHDDYKNSQLAQRMREKLVEDIKVTPSEVRQYFRNMPEDSIPYVPTEVEVEIITRTPKIPIEEINRVKDELRGYTERIQKGETTFQTLARFYSEDPGTARNGGELDYTGRGMLDPAFAAVAFNLTDSRKISKIVESEFGFHIIQLIDKRGDKIKVRHILRKPRVSQEAIDEGINMLDSLTTEMANGKFTFEEAATYVSDDKDTRSNKGLMFNSTEDGRTSKFRMQDLPTEVARVIEKMKVGDVSPAFTMTNNRGKTVCAVVKLKSRVEGHRATITEDFQVMKDVVLSKRKAEFIHEWVKNKIKNTYISMKSRYKNGDYEYDGWVQE